MSNNSLLKKVKNIPVPILPTMVGAATLSNVYLGMGYTWIRHFTMWAATIILIAYTVKIVVYPKVCAKEYSNTVPASLYAGFTMVFMILGSYFFDFSNILGKILWSIGLGAHAIHILIFTYRNVIKGINIDTFLPSWFVTYNGIMVSAVIGGVMNEPTICRIVTIYGIIVFIIIMPFMLYRLFKHPIKEGVYHTQAILLAPSSLCLVCYLTYFKEPNKLIVYSLYAIILCTLVFIVLKLRKFFSFIFAPGFAGLTFPMAIGIVASTKMAAYLTTEGLDGLSNIAKQISGFQIYITTGIISLVVFKFFMLFLDSYKEN